MQVENNKDRGRAGLSLAIAYFGTNGYTVSLPMNDTQWYDLIVEKDGIFQTVQCKFTAAEKKVIGFRSAGGSNGDVYDNILNHPLDLLFCADDEMNLFVIPMSDIREHGCQTQITLSKTKFTNNNSAFQTYKYLVQI